jgi:hypothetical protein
MKSHPIYSKSDLLRGSLDSVFCAGGNSGIWPFSFSRLGWLPKQKTKGTKAYFLAEPLSDVAWRAIRVVSKPDKATSLVLGFVSRVSSGQSSRHVLREFCTAS